MAMLSINDLPEDVLVELLSHVAEYDLIHCCRLVCSLWRDVVDMPTLWKRKCQLEGFSPKGGIRIPDDWKSFYFLFKLRKNLIRNPCAKEGFNSWRIDEDGGDKWAIEELPGGHGQPIPLPDVKKYFVTSFSDCKKSQFIDLKADGYWEELMDEVQPDIVVTDWYAARYDCGCQYEVCVQLLSEDFIVLQEFCPEPVLIDQWSDAKWRQMSHTFRNYGPGVRHIKFQHGGKDRQFWAGWYGVRVTSSSLVIEPPISDGQ
ncbi:F-box only protein 6-like isoform X1 [Ambystoma mexicanum]|uniref:F-box only protein 6-like isoform X1 n=1 Tax=Ambystoma mexicanum TaxID=8296 RepID=UPI0037E85394